MESPPVLSLPKRGCTYMFDTDESKNSLGEVLMQEKEVKGEDSSENEKQWVTVGFCSKTLMAADVTISRQKESDSKWFGI